MDVFPPRPPPYPCTAPLVHSQTHSHNNLPCHKESEVLTKLPSISQLARLLPSPNRRPLPPAWAGVWPSGSFFFLLCLHLRAGPYSEFPMETLGPRSTRNGGSSIFPHDEECLHSIGEEMNEAGTGDLNDSPRSHHRSG